MYANLVGQHGWVTNALGVVMSDNSHLRTYDVNYIHNSDSEVFRCQAEDEDHAMEQCKNAYPKCLILYVEDTVNYDEA
jgi:hypothetical protein